MSVGRVAFRASRALRAAGPTAGTITESEQASRQTDKDNVFKKGASRDPELYVCLPWAFPSAWLDFERGGY